ncbi:5-hydroxytryptamine receptor 4-like [Gigantopelta aegis]|uniref:5-hydroxytryptamine receptor 4-like n=1 Tax=Gigantopelta aegis TaxID=1735272 RepID=UPI001B88A16D|nr:5-hydroxytryptamine receptor 4-like [Gigantopelta aegis]XP_041370620.1 5-hydroxytryptamine receptor 4-like [Gigantopelta aegis]XP_041370621.1 5-hydroxytryptamine receptor 4-like [Gigantopelta aegis]
MSNTTLNCDDILADKPGPPPLYSTGTRYGIAAVLTCFPILCLVGNTVVILSVATHRRLRTITNAFVVSLAVADMSVSVLVMPFSIYSQLNNKQWMLGETLCLVGISFDVMLCTISIFHLSCLAIDRYLAICQPFVHERMTSQIVVMMLTCCWVIPIFISFVPVMNKWNTIGIEDFIECAAPPGSNTCVFLVNVTFSLICSAVAFYIPVVFMGVCNWKIYLCARRQAMQIRSLDNAVHHQHSLKGKGKFKQEAKAAKTLGIIMGCFSVCWFPFFIFNIFDPLIGYKIPYIPWSVALWLGYINSVMNPFLYYYFNRNFKFAFRRLLKCKVCRGISEYEEDPITGTTHLSE